jgi:hypothetical protein
MAGNVGYMLGMRALCALHFLSILRAQLSDHPTDFELVTVVRSDRRHGQRIIQ